MTLHELLGEGLACFQTCGGLRGAEDAQAEAEKLVDETEGEGKLGTDDGERGPFGLDDAQYGGEVACIDRDAAGGLCDARVSRRADDLGHSRGLG